MLILMWSNKISWRHKSPCWSRDLDKFDIWKNASKISSKLSSCVKNLLVGYARVLRCDFEWKFYSELFKYFAYNVCTHVTTKSKQLKWSWKEMCIQMKWKSWNAHKFESIAYSWAPHDIEQTLFTFPFDKCKCEW